jgi:ribosomal-protein-alanine N-acetyltransferase
MPQTSPRAEQAKPDPIRPLEPSDAVALAELYLRNRAFLAPFEPERPDDFFTADGQLARAREIAGEEAAGRTRSYVVLDDDGAMAGTITLSGIARGPAQSAHVGYWIDRERNGRGLATRALGAVVEEAFGPLGLHRIEAGILPDNRASRIVLERNGFELIGLAPAYLLIAGAWRDHLLFQRVRQS